MQGSDARELLTGACTPERAFRLLTLQVQEVDLVPRRSMLGQCGGR